MVIDLPEEYQKRRACGFGSSHGIARHAPAFLIIGAYGQPPWTIWLDVVMDTNVGVQWALLPTDPTIEEGIVRELRRATCRRTCPQNASATRRNWSSPAFCGWR
jgi:hypothetical protein